MTAQVQAQCDAASIAAVLLLTIFLQLMGTDSQQSNLLVLVHGAPTALLNRNPRQLVYSTGPGRQYGAQPRGSGKSSAGSGRLVCGLPWANAMSAVAGRVLRSLLSSPSLSANLSRRGNQPAGGLLSVDLWSPAPILPNGVFSSSTCADNPTPFTRGGAGDVACATPRLLEAIAGGPSAAERIGPRSPFLMSLGERGIWRPSVGGRSWEDSAWQGACPSLVRSMSVNGPKPRHKGGKIKTPSSLKSRFKLTGSGKFLRKHAGHVHKRMQKSKRTNRKLSKSALLHKGYCKTLRKLNFKIRHLAS
eukprot:evm.model.scf_1907.3 EVM.evm.TU.scf_1907.3   scf_1907:13720-15426(-)